MKEIDTHALDLTQIHCSHFLKFNFPFCKKIFTEKQIQYLLTVLDNSIIIDKEEEKYFIKSMEMLYEYDPSKAREFFFEEIYHRIRYRSNDFTSDDNSVSCRFLRLGVAKGWLSSKEDINSFLYNIFKENYQQNLFIFCSIIKIIDPKISIEKCY